MATEGDSPSEEEVREVVLGILKESDLENTTEAKVRSLASEKLGADLNQSFYKKLVRKVVADYLDERAEAETEARKCEKGEEVGVTSHPKAENISGDDEEDGNASDGGQSSRFSRKPPPYTKQQKPNSGGDEDNIICQLSSKRNVSIQKFRGKTLVSIREYYEKDGELRPSAKGISLSVDQWRVLKSNVSAIEKAISQFA
ncbi:hypothetical protein KP509_13G007700 [Ceratopteris richardii]|uniref:DEK-C domain-containing protein n=1 Tax=Ceratopteris richardii TaxID=49495 RepID=A0A8T2TGF3_CERRI|nr:hypothetical protein KP509_13G007700 [Ceratopteris richardii]